MALTALGLYTGRTAHMWSRGIALPFLDHGTRRRRGVSVTPRPLFTPRRKTRYPLYRRLGGPRGASGQVRKISPPPGFDSRTVQPVASRYTNWAISAHIMWYTNADILKCTLRNYSLVSSSGSLLTAYAQCNYCYHHHYHRHHHHHHHHHQLVTLHSQLHLIKHYEHSDARRDAYFITSAHTASIYIQIKACGALRQNTLTFTTTFCSCKILK